VIEAALALSLGLAIGVLLGLVGGGGSILAVPALVYVLGEPVKSATTESLLVVGSAALIGALAYARAGRIDVRLGLALGAAGSAGAIAGTVLNRLAPDRAILLPFSAVLLAAAIGMFLRSRNAEAPATDEPPLWSRVVPIGLGTGALTGFFGVGGGFVVVPALVVLLGLPMTAAVGTSLLVIAVTSAAALAAHLASGGVDWRVTGTLTAASIGGTLIGRRLAAHVRPVALARGFAALLVAIAAVVIAHG
jgi:uncharacterized membrane protein YfcA